MVHLCICHLLFTSFSFLQGLNMPLPHVYPRQLDDPPVTSAAHQGSLLPHAVDITLLEHTEKLELFEDGSATKSVLQRPDDRRRRASSARNRLLEHVFKAKRACLASVLGHFPACERR